MFMLISIKPIKNCSPSKIRQSINGEWYTCDRNCNNSFKKSKKNFDRLMKRGTFYSKKKKKEIKIWAVKILFPLDFAIHLSYSEVQKNRKVDNV